MTPCPVSHVEWRVSDLVRAQALFEGLFGWRFERFSDHYALYTPQAGVCVGLFETAERSSGDSPMIHVAVTGLHQAVDKALALGARLDVPVRTIDGYGRYAQVLDADGNRVGLFEALGDTPTPWAT